VSVVLRSLRLLQEEYTNKGYGGSYETNDKRKDIFVAIAGIPVLLILR